MTTLKQLICISILCVLGSGCATKVIQVSIPDAVDPNVQKGYAKIEKIEDLRNFQRKPSDPSIPSIEGDNIDDKEITDKVIGRMRHGLYHKALWNYTIKNYQDVYGVCRKVVTSSLSSAGYIVVKEGHEQYDNALPLAVDILQFWAWMQPQFNIDLHFDGELRVKSLDSERPLDVTANGTEFFSTGFAGGSAWNKVVNQGLKDLDKDLVSKLKSEYTD